MNTQHDFSMPGHAPDGLFQKHGQPRRGSTAVQRMCSGSARMLRLGLLCLLVVLGGAPFRAAIAQTPTTVNMAQVPLLALKSAPGLVMLTMSRDHRLYYAAYNDTSDIDGDGVIDVGFKPNITYYGYFVPDRCYQYTGSGNSARFKPVSVASATDGCASSSGRWHGNWMNWMATSRMDALRKVLYGGNRSTDSTTQTFLQAAHIPPESHIWGKEYRPAPKGPDTYNITYYTPMSTPAAGKMHIFLMKSDGVPGTGASSITYKPPTLRAISEVDIDIDRVWVWSSSERPIGGATGATGYSRPAGKLITVPGDPSGLPVYPQSGGYPAKAFTSFITPPTIRVEACVAIGGVREPECKGYPAASPTIWKPTGVLHDYSETDALKFGLLTGSYLNNYSGGVLRKDIGSFKNEFDASTGIFNSTVGIVKTIDRLTTYGFHTESGDNYSYECGFDWSGLRQQGKCQMWGAPVGEMMYEGLRYFTDKQPTSAFVTGVAASSSPDTQLQLPTVTTWQNPFRPTASGGSPICSRPVQMVIADPITSFDSDQLPGAAFTPAAGFGAAVVGDLPGLNVGTQADAIWTSEFGATSKNFFVGQSTTSNYDGNPTPKPATTFKTIRGHAPDETTSQGSFYAAGVARFGRETGVTIRSSPTNTVPNTAVDTISVALGSVIPRVEMVHQGKTVTLVPFSKSVGGGANNTPGAFQTTGLITMLAFDRIANTPVANSDPFNGGRPYMRFMVSFSDADQGTDNEADANLYYSMWVDAANLVNVRLDSYYQAGSIKQNMGYVISGTSKDGVYLDIRDRGDNPGAIYYLDTLPGQDPAPALPALRSPYNTTALSDVAAQRTFTLSGTSAASYVPHDVLWYAAKWGGPRDSSNVPVVDATGKPANYFKISNPSELPAQMGKAFRSAAALAAVSSTSVVGVGQRSLGSAAIYQANYDSLTWSSRVYAFPVATNGSLSNTPIWEASSLIPVPASRTKLFLGRGGTNTPLQLAAGGFASLTAAEQADFGTTDTYAYLLGDKSKEERKGGIFRNRGTTAGAEFGSVLGDIVNSDPQIISKKDYGYTASDASYGTFLSGINFETLAVGSNDGFFHVFDAQPDATGGGELLGFMPQAARTNIKDLAAPGYQHRNIVDGAIGLGHAKIAVPGDATPGWRSVAVAAGGDGAQTVFAINTSSKTFTADSILWEINQSSPGVGSTLGNVMGRPAIGKLANGTWVAIFGNGYNSADGTANLYVVRLTDGAILNIIPTNNAFTGNGLGSTEIVRKTSGDQDTIEYVYAADYKGHIWRFDLSNSSMASWPGTGALIYSTPSGRPITAEVKVGPAPASPLTTGGKMIYFGTGSYLSAADPAITTVQALYGIYDDLLHGLNTSPFAVDADLSSMTINATAGSDVRTTSNAASPSWFTVAGKKGWIVQLTGTNVAPGERVIAPPVRYTAAGLVDAFLFTSIVPSVDECEAGLDAWITGIDAMTGGYKKVFNGIDNNSVRIRGGSPRGVFVLQDGGAPTLYISQTVFNGTIPTTSFATGAGGTQTVTINGVEGTTRVISIGLVNPVSPASSNRQVWRQLK